MIVDGMHLTMAYLACIGKLYGDGGLLSLLTESVVYAHATCRQIWQGKHFARGVRAMKLAQEAILEVFHTVANTWCSKHGEMLIDSYTSEKLYALSTACFKKDKDNRYMNAVVSNITGKLDYVKILLNDFEAEGAKASATFRYWEHNL